MLVKYLRRSLFSSLREISSIQYRNANMMMLPSVLKTPPNKTELSLQIKKHLSEICPNLPQAKVAFGQMQQKVEDLYAYIKRNILTEKDQELDESFFQRAHYYFQKQGKKIRPIMIVMLAQNFKQTLLRKNPNIDFSSLDRDILKWCGLIQIMHIASLAHDDIVDDSPSRRGQQSQHLKFGSRTAVFSGNYIISKASSRLYTIYAHTMASLAEGEIKQLIAKRQNKFVNENDGKNQGFQKMMDRYMQKTYHKSAALMCGSLLGVPNIFHKHFGTLLSETLGRSFEDLQQISFRAGQHYGLALQLIDDILDYVSTAEEMGKQQMADLVQGNVTAPVYLTYLHKKKIQQNGSNIVTLELLNKNKKNKEDAMIVKKWVESGVGIQLTYLLGALHCQQGLKELDKLGNRGEDLLAWRYLGYKLMTRKK